MFTNNSNVDIGSIGSMASTFIYEIKVPFIIVLALVFGFFIIETIIFNTHNE